jgi:predicted O-linked N-acetylglucosamine transferase (SPINDLY family)
MYNVAALKQLARVLSDHQRLESAEGALWQCISLNPHQKDVLEQYVSMRLGQCRWPTVVPWEGVDRKTLVGGIHPLSMAAYTDDPLLQLGAAAQSVKQGLAEKPTNRLSDRRHAAIDLSDRRLRVGYVSSDLRDHAVGYLMAEFFEVHDRSKVEVIAYYCGQASSEPLNTRIRSAVERWVDIRTMSDDQAAAQIAADGVDILVDVNGHTRDARPGVFARRPAPIQVNWLGYPGTMGSPFHHYIVADPFVIPAGSELYYSEKVVRLPCYQPNDRKRQVGPAPTRAEVGLPEDAFVFCCFNGPHKITRFTFDRWLEILRRAPHSVLWLLDSTPETRANLIRYAEANGVPAARIVFAPKMQNALHLARYPLADLFLDTTPYGAHTTASDALWMGVPMLTLAGRCFASRVCGSLVRAAGLPELIVEDPADYVARAVALSNAPEEIAAYKARLEANRATCDLFNMDQLAASLEDLYLDMVEDYRSGRLPQPDLRNLDAYFEAGLGHDHDAVEMLGVADYHGWYRRALAAQHAVWPLQPDSRLWTEAEIALADGGAAVAKPAHRVPAAVG